MFELAIILYFSLWFMKLPLVLRGGTNFTYLYYRRKGQQVHFSVYIVAAIAVMILSLTGLFIMLWYEGADFFRPYDNEVLDAIAEDLLRGD